MTWTQSELGLILIYSICRVSIAKTCALVLHKCYFRLHRINLPLLSFCHKQGWYPDFSLVPQCTPMYAQGSGNLGTLSPTPTVCPAPCLPSTLSPSCLPDVSICCGCEIVLGFFFEQVWDFFFDFLAGTICLVFATVWNLNLSFCMVFATFGHVHLPFRMGFTTCGHVHLPFCMVFATFWHVHLPFCMGCSTCEHVHPNIYRCGSLGLDKKRVGGIEGGH